VKQNLLLLANLTSLTKLGLLILRNLLKTRMCLKIPAYMARPLFPTAYKRHDYAGLERVIQELLRENVSTGIDESIVNFRVATRLHSYIVPLLNERRPTMTKAKIHFHQTASLTPEEYIAGLTDFGPGRSKLFGNSADEYLQVYYLGQKEADVTVGSGGIWERLYDWSDPTHVVLTTIDSNVRGGASGHIYAFTRNANGTTDIDLDVVREGKNLKGLLLGFVLRTIGRSVLDKAFVNSVKLSKQAT